MKKVILILGFFCLSACQTVVRLPSTTGQHPDIGGEAWDGQVGLQVAQAVPVTVINDYTATPPRRDTIAIGQEDILFGLTGIALFSGAFFNFNLRIIKRLEFYAANSYGLKFMVLGEPGATGYKGTIFAGAFSNGLGSQTESSGGSTISQSSTVSGTEFGASFGYRKSPATLFYGTLASRGGDAKISIDNNGTVSDYNDNYDQYMLALGVNLGSTWYFNAELTANNVVWRGTNTDGSREISDAATETGINAGFGYAW